VRFNGFAEFAQKVARKAQMFLDGPKRGDIIAVIGLLDLYGPDFYPDDVATVKDRYDWGVAYFQKEVARDRFRMFFAVHEFEAWLLSQPDIFPKQVKSAFSGKISQPEQVNFHEPPAKLLNRIYKQRLKREYKKTTYGRELFAKLDPGVAVAKCPYLKGMLDEILSMARAAGL
jgi:hypothetical protein